MQGKGVYFNTPRLGDWEERIPLGLPPLMSADLDCQPPRSSHPIAYLLAGQLHSRGLLYLFGMSELLL